MERLSDNDLLALLNDVESDTSERKRSFSRNKNLPYDLYPVPVAKLSDLSRVIFEEEYLPEAFAPDILIDNNRTYEERLASCKMIVSINDTTPNVHGLLSIGKNPQEFLSGAYIQFLRIDGVRLTDEIIDEEKINGDITSLLRRTMEKIKAHNRRAIDVTSGDTHKINTPYPLTAIQQILYNSVLHRTYERTNAPIRLHWFNDRIEITSPGGPYGNVTPDNLGLPGITDYRNPNLAATMKTLGFVQTFGRGIAIARDEMKKNGNPGLEFIANQNIVVCIIKAKNNGESHIS